MTEENTAPATDEHASPDCGNRTCNPDPCGSHCSLDGVPCETKECPYISPLSGQDDPEHACGDDDEACGEDPEPKESPTPEEIAAAWEHLRSLVKRADFHATAFIAFDGGENNQFASSTSDSLLMPETINDPAPHLPWVGVLGAIYLAHNIAKKDPDAIKTGIGHFIDIRLKKRPTNRLFSIFRNLAEEQGEQDSTED